MSILASSGARVMEEKSNDTHNHNATHTVDHSQPVGPHTFRLHLHEAQKQNIGPGSYSPSVDYVTEASPRTKFGLSHRFLPSKVGYISPRHNSDLLCTASPGPKYAIVPNATTYPRAPALSWGEKLTQEQYQKKQQLQASAQETDTSPSYYNPKIGVIKETAPRCAFSRSSRFGGPFGSYQVLNNSSTPTTNQIQPNFETTLPSSPRYSFGPKRSPEAHPTAVRHKPRTSWMTHSIRGGLSKPATLECQVGPGDYSPNNGDISTNHSVRHSFAKDDRFLKPGVQYLSAEHAKGNVGTASPGPRYLYSVNSIGYQSGSKTARTSGLKWIP